MNTIKLNHIPLSDPTNTSPLPNPTNTNPLSIQIPNTNPITNYHSNPNPIFNNTVNSNNYDFTPISIINMLSHYNGITMTKIRCPLFIFNKLHELNKNHNFSNCNGSINICVQKNCLTCDNLDTSHFYRSTITGRVYHINFNQLSCKSKMLYIY